MTNKPAIKSNFSANSSPPLQKLFGEIINQEKKKNYKKNQFYGNTYFKLQVISEEKRHIFFVYPNLVNNSVLHEIEQYKYFGKQYLFFCEKRKRKGWNLHYWKIKDHD